MFSIIPIQKFASERSRGGCDFFGPALGDDEAAIFSAFGAEVDDPVGITNDVEIVLDDDDGVAEVGEAMQYVEQLAYVVKVKAGGGLVQKVKGASGLSLGKLASELHALRFATAEGGGGLAEVDVAQADVDEGLQLLIHLRDVGEYGQSIFNGEVEYVGDGVSVEFHREGFLIVAAAVADFAEHVDIGQEIHFDAALTISLARFAAASGDVEGKTPSLVAAFAGSGEHRKQITNGSEDAGVRGGVGSRRSTDGRLVDANGFVELIESCDGCVLAGSFAGAVKLVRERAIENVVDERALAGAADAGNNRHDADREAGAEVLQVVTARAFNGDPFVGERARLIAVQDADVAAEIAACEGCGGIHDLLRRAFRNDVSAEFTGTGTKIENIVRVPDGVLIVFDDKHGVSQIAQRFEGCDEPLIVALMQSDRRLVEYVEDSAEARTDLRREANALALAAGKRGRVAIERQIAETDGVQELETFDDFTAQAFGDQGFAGGELNFLCCCQ